MNLSFMLLHFQIASNVFWSFSGKVFPWCRKDDNGKDLVSAEGGKINEGFAPDKSEKQKEVIINTPKQKVLLAPCAQFDILKSHYRSDTVNLNIVNSKFSFKPKFPSNWWRQQISKDITKD